MDQTAPQNFICRSCQSPERRFFLKDVRTHAGGGFDYVYVCAAERCRAAMPVWRPDLPPLREKLDA